MAVMPRLRVSLGRFASDGPVPVFVAVGAGRRDACEDLLLHPDLQPMLSPRHASVLVVAGEVPNDLQGAVARIHDQVSHPRTTIRWNGGSDPVPKIRSRYRDLLSGSRESESHWLEDEPPEPWRGRGPHGQGGEGMMGGKPYGRPMAMMGPDVRDGLALDRLTLTVGPFFPPWAPGLVVEMSLQGDVVQEAEVKHDPFPQRGDPVVDRVREESADRARLEHARARLLLRRAGRVFRAAGAPVVAARAMGLAGRPRPDAARARSLHVMARRSGALASLPSAADRPDWSDVRARVGRWLEAAEHAMRAAEDPSKGRAGPLAPEGLGLPFSDDVGPREALDRWTELVPGLEWGEATLILVAEDPVPRGSGEGEP